MRAEFRPSSSWSGVDRLFPFRSVVASTLGASFADDPVRDWPTGLRIPDHERVLCDGAVVNELGSWCGGVNQWCRYH